MKEIVFLNGSGIDENIPVFKIEVGLIEIIFTVNRSGIDEKYIVLYLSLNKSSIDEKYLSRQIEVGLIKVIFCNWMEVGLMKKCRHEMEAGLMKKTVSRNGSGIDENIPVLK